MNARLESRRALSVRIFRGRGSFNRRPQYHLLSSLAMLYSAFDTSAVAEASAERVHKIVT